MNIIHISKSTILVMGLVLLLVFLVMVPVYITAATTGQTPKTSMIAAFQEYWIFRLSLNLLGYATIIIPGYFLIQYFRNNNYLERAGSGFFPNIVRLCIQGRDAEKTSLEEGQTPSTEPKAEQTFYSQCLQLCWCAGGLLGSYLIWGLLQERIMAIKYGATESSPGENFKNSQFLVFMNRILAFMVAIIYVSLTKQPSHTAPLYKYSYSSFSNIMSSWCQYEALKFVSFPVQVLAKASKVIPVMLMGKLVSKKTYAVYEYITAVFISVGTGIFLLSSKENIQGGEATTISGIIILLGYLTFDAFTSNWQGELFRTYSVSSVQMMAGVNFFSVIFTSVSLVEQGGFVESMSFMSRNPSFMIHIIILSITSATGQLFIFYTIQKFGAVTFTIIMTIRQGIAILLSCIVYQHPVNILGGFGIAFVFAAVFAKIQIGRQSKKAPQASKASTSLAGITKV